MLPINSIIYTQTDTITGSRISPKRVSSVRFRQTTSIKPEGSNCPRAKTEIPTEISLTLLQTGISRKVAEISVVTIAFERSSVKNYPANDHERGKSECKMNVISIQKRRAVVECRKKGRGGINVSAERFTSADAKMSNVLVLHLATSRRIAGGNYERDMRCRSRVFYRNLAAEIVNPLHIQADPNAKWSHGELTRRTKQNAKLCYIQLSQLYIHNDTIDSVTRYCYYNCRLARTCRTYITSFALSPKYLLIIRADSII